MNKKYASSGTPYSVFGSTEAPVRPRRTANVRSRRAQTAAAVGGGRVRRRTGQANAGSSKGSSENKSGILGRHLEVSSLGPAVGCPNVRQYRRRCPRPA